MHRICPLLTQSGHCCFGLPELDYGPSWKTCVSYQELRLCCAAKERQPNTVGGFDVRHAFHPSRCWKTSRGGNDWLLQVPQPPVRRPLLEHTWLGPHRDNFRAGSIGARVLRRIRSKARGMKMARVRRSGTPMRILQATLRTAIPVTSQTITITVTRRTSR